MALALFDLDNTLLEGDSDYEWGEFLVRKNLVDKEEYAKENLYFYEEYKRGTLDIFEYSAFSFKPFTTRTQEELDKLHKEFMKESIIPIIRSKAQQTINQHKKQGDTVILITATNTFIGNPIAEHFGIEYILATQPKIIKGKYTTEIEGTPCFQEGKVTRLNVWTEEHNKNLKGSCFYSDSINDLALLEAVDKPIAVNPDKPLQDIAKRRNWSIISLR